MEAVFSVGNTLTYGSLIEQLRSCYSAVGCECGIGKTKKLKLFLTNKRMIIQGEDKLYRYNQDLTPFTGSVQSGRIYDEPS